jgi:hypothetical protein
MNELTTYRAPTPPAPMTRQEQDRVSFLLNKLTAGPRGTFSISDQLAPVGDEWDALQARYARFTASVMPPQTPEAKDAAKDAIKARIVRLLVRYPSMNNTDATAIVAAYTADLVKFPLWAIDEAILTILRYGANNPAFPPSSTELVQACERAVKPVIAERAELQKLVNADVYHEPTEGERERVNAEFQKLKRELAMDQDFKKVLPDARYPNCDQATVRAQIEADLETLRAKPLPKLSPEALATLGIKPPAAKVEAA